MVSDGASSGKNVPAQWYYLLTVSTVFLIYISFYLTCCYLLGLMWIRGLGHQDFGLGLAFFYQILDLGLGSQVLVNITALDPFRGSGIPSILSERLKTQTLCVAHILTTTSQHVLAI